MNKSVEIYIYRIGDQIDVKNRVIQLLSQLDDSNPERKRYDGLSESINESFSRWTEEDKMTSSYILSPESFEHEVQKKNWRWTGYNVDDCKLTILISHDPYSNYRDLIYLLMACGVTYHQIFINDGVFGKFWLSQVNYIS